VLSVNLFSKLLIHVGSSFARLVHLPRIKMMNKDDDDDDAVISNTFMYILTVASVDLS